MTTNPLVLNNVDVVLNLDNGRIELLVDRGSPAALAIGLITADDHMFMSGPLMVEFRESIAPTKEDIAALPLLQASTELAQPTLAPNTVHIVNGVASYHGIAHLSGGGCGYCETHELHLGSRTLSEVVAFLQEVGSIHSTERFTITITVDPNVTEEPYVG